jgi:ribosomal protein S18 acetylase RimI-like enzyme
VRLIRLRASNIYRLNELVRTPNANSWTSEVESFILDGGAASHRFEPSSSILLAEVDGQIVGAAVHHPSDMFHGAQYVSAVLVDHRRRGSGFGRQLLRAVLDDARESSGRPYVLWVVHPENTAMITLSRSLVSTGSEITRDASTGYLTFVYP